MTPPTVVRIPRVPTSFLGYMAHALERGELPKVRARYRKCVALQDDGSPCAMPARYLDFKRGGHVCFEHRPTPRKEALSL